MRTGALTVALCAIVFGCSTGCLKPPELLKAGVKVWGRRGLEDGRFMKPRAITIDSEDRLYIVDKTARIQVFDRDGNFLRGWRTPASKNGKPCGLSMSHDNLLMVADTHYFRVLFYTLDGELLEEKTIGGTCGRGPGEFGFVTDVVQDSKGNYYVSEYGDFDRVQKFDPDGEFVYQLGGHGQEVGQFQRPQGLFMDPNDQLWIADACNGRIQVFDVSGEEPKFVKCWGDVGTELGQIRYPYQMHLDGEGHIYICEFANHRIQKFTLDGKSLGAWGGAGREPGQLHQPWAMAVDSVGDFHVVDSYNHRMQRFTFPE